MCKCDHFFMCNFLAQTVLISSSNSSTTTDVVTKNDALEKQLILQNDTDNFNKNTKPRKPSKKDIKALTNENVDRRFKA